MTTGLEPGEFRVWPGAPIAPSWRLRSDTLSVTACALGAHLVDVRIADGDGDRGADDGALVSLDYPQVPNPRGYHGATAGRWANRIAGARFTLGGIEHRLEPNEGPNQLHGGPSGFNLHIWELIDTIEGRDTAGVVLRHVSADGDQGFPGRLAATATFVVRGDRLEITYEAETDRPTVVNLTSHLYWNLAGGGPLDGHRLTVAAERYVEVDEANIPIAGPPLPVAGTRFDCRSGSDLASVTAAGGFDHCFVLGADEDRAAVQLEHLSGRSIELTTDQPGCQIYTGQHLDPMHRGVAIEAQRIPDSPNRPDLGVSVLRPGERYRNRTVVRVDG